MCNYPQQNDIWLETSGEGQEGEKKEHTQLKIDGHDTAQTHTETKATYAHDTDLTVWFFWNLCCLGSMLV